MKKCVMTPRERLTAALNRRPVDRIPWTVDLDYYNSALSDQGKLDTRYEGVAGFLSFLLPTSIMPESPSSSLRSSLRVASILSIA